MSGAVVRVGVVGLTWGILKFNSIQKQCIIVKKILWTVFIHLYFVVQGINEVYLLPLQYIW